MILQRCRSASVSNQTSTGQRLLQTVSKNADGSNLTTFVVSGPVFTCNIQETKGDSLPIPFSQLDLSFFDLFIPHTISFNASDRVRVDGVDYEVQDTDDWLSPDQISRKYLISKLTP